MDMLAMVTGGWDLGGEDQILIKNAVKVTLTPLWWHLIAFLLNVLSYST